MMDICTDPLYSDSKLISINGFGSTITSGQPQFPIRYDRIIIPQGMDYKITIVDSNYIEINGKLGPARPPLNDYEYTTYDTTNVPPLSNYSGYFPSNIVENNSIEEYRDNYTSLISISPVSYNLTENKIKLYSLIKYKVSFVPILQDDETITNISALSDVSIEGLPELLANEVINPHSIQPISTFANPTTRPNGTFEEFDVHYLILSLYKYKGPVEDFANWKKKMGLKTHVVLSNNWTPTSIKQTIKEYYYNYRISFVLLIGNQEDIPCEVKKYRVYNKTYTTYTDLYYTCMGGVNDNMPDIYRGRIPADNVTEVTTILNKIIEYEKCPPSENYYFSNASVCAYFQDNDNNGYEDRRFTLTMEDIYNYLTSKGKSMKRIYYAKNPSGKQLKWNNSKYGFGGLLPDSLQYPKFLWNGNRQDIINSFNSGNFLIIHRDHGTSSGWTDPSFTINDIQYLKNKSLPVVFSMNCETGKYVLAEDCFVEALLKKGNAGAVSVIGATETSWSGYNDALVTGMIDAIWPKPGIVARIPSTSDSITKSANSMYFLGQILDQGLLRTTQTYGQNTNEPRIGATWELFHCFGDPSMRIYSKYPTPIEILKPQIQRASNHISVRVPRGCFVSFYNIETGEVDTYSVSIMSYPTTQADKIEVILSGPNMVPYIDSPSTSSKIASSSLDSTIIDNEGSESQPSIIYDSLGREIIFDGNYDSLKPGFYIIDNKKIIIQ